MTYIAGLPIFLLATLGFLALTVCSCTTWHDMCLDATHAVHLDWVGMLRTTQPYSKPTHPPAEACRLQSADCSIPSHIARLPE